MEQDQKKDQKNEIADTSENQIETPTLDTHSKGQHAITVKRKGTLRKLAGLITENNKKLKKLRNPKISQEVMETSS